MIQSFRLPARKSAFSVKMPFISNIFRCHHNCVGGVSRLTKLSGQGPGRGGKGVF